jgi:hypothetical protein
VVCDETKLRLVKHRGGSFDLAGRIPVTLYRNGHVDVRPHGVIGDSPKYFVTTSPNMSSLLNKTSAHPLAVMDAS